MIGAVIGDLAGSVYEYYQFYKTQPLKIEKIFPDDAFFSDDSILTVAIADAIINKCDYGQKLKEYGKRFQDYLPEGVPYFKKMFSQSFMSWLDEDTAGESKGNGAMMRISPIGWLFNSEEEVTKNVKLATMPSHNTSEALDCATLVALTIFYARQGLSKDEIYQKLNLPKEKPSITKFNYTCSDTVDLVFYSLYNGKDFEDCIKIALSFGGDTDTNACIVGSMAEAFYGVEKELHDTALSYLPKDFVDIINKCENIIDSEKER